MIKYFAVHIPSVVKPTDDSILKKKGLQKHLLHKGLNQLAIIRDNIYKNVFYIYYMLWIYNCKYDT